MDAYGAGYLELVMVADDGSYIDIPDVSQLSQYMITGQNIAPNTQLTMTFMKDSSGNEYDNLTDRQNYESITLNVKKTGEGTATAAAEDTKTAETASANSVDSAGTKSGSSDTDSNYVSKEFKETMDAYEDFFDEYVEFMQNYDATDTKQLTEYLGLMITYTEYMDELSDIEDQDLSDADYAYYLEVNSRILKKLSGIS